MVNPTFIHTADLHVDKSVNSLINPHTGISYAIESNMRAVKDLVDDAIEKNVTSVIIAGDTFDEGGMARPETYIQLAEQLIRLINHGINVDIDTGNHDFHNTINFKNNPVMLLESMLTRTGQSYGKIFVSENIELNDHGPFDVLSIPYLSSAHVKHITGQQSNYADDGSNKDNLMVRDYIKTRIDQLMSNRPDQNKPYIISGHFTVDAAIPANRLPLIDTTFTHYSAEPIICLKDITQFEPAYLALGHIHEPTNLKGHGRYSGCLNKLTITDSSHAKGYVHVELEGKNTKQTFIPTKNPRGIYAYTSLDDLPTNLNLEPGDIIRVTMDNDDHLPDWLTKQAHDASAKALKHVTKKKAPAVIYPTTKLTPGQNIDILAVIKEFVDNNNPDTPPEQLEATKNYLEQVYTAVTNKNK